MSRILGRTNEAWSQTWLRPLPTPCWEQTLAALVGTDAVLDVSASTGLWCHGLRNHRGKLVVVGESDLGSLRADAAGDALMAELIQTLSCMAGRRPDLWFLRVRKPATAEVARAAFEVLETARQDGAFRFLGLFADGSADAALSVWALNDAFDALLLPPSLDGEQELLALAAKRRVGVVRLGPDAAGADCRIVGVSTVDQVRLHTGGNP
ncbi:MAG: hypothetical protein WHU10_08645 [Fimbriimonadales bacterium]